MSMGANGAAREHSHGARLTPSPRAATATGSPRLLAPHRAETTSRHAAQLRCLWNGISKSDANDIAKTTASGTAIASVTRNVGIPDPTSETSHDVMDRHHDRRVGEVQAVGACAEPLERPGLEQRGRRGSACRRRPPRAVAPSQVRARDRPRRSCRRSTPIRALRSPARPGRPRRAPASATEADARGRTRRGSPRRRCRP